MKIWWCGGNFDDTVEKVDDDARKLSVMVEKYSTKRHTCDALKLGGKGQELADWLNYACINWQTLSKKDACQALKTEIWNIRVYSFIFG